MDWIEELYVEDNIDKALDLLLDKIDEIYSNGSLEPYDEMLIIIDPERLDECVSTGVLSYLYRFKEGLSQYSVYLEKTRKVLENRGLDANEILHRFDE